MPSRDRGRLYQGGRFTKLIYRTPLDTLWNFCTLPHFLARNTVRNGGGKGTETFKNFDNVRRPFQRGKKEKLWHFARCAYQNINERNSRSPWFPGIFAAETDRKPRKRGGKGAKMRQKHRTSWPQTSVLSRQNLGCLSLRSPMFSFFRPEIAGKPCKCVSETLMLHFCDISEQGWCWWLPRPFPGRYLHSVQCRKRGVECPCGKLHTQLFFAVLQRRRCGPAGSP